MITPSMIPKALTYKAKLNKNVLSDETYVRLQILALKVDVADSGEEITELIKEYRDLLNNT